MSVEVRIVLRAQHRLAPECKPHNGIQCRRGHHWLNNPLSLASCPPDALPCSMHLCEQKRSYCIIPINVRRCRCPAYQTPHRQTKHLAVAKNTIDQRTACSATLVICTLGLEQENRLRLQLCTLCHQQLIQHKHVQDRTRAFSSGPSATVPAFHLG